MVQATIASLPPAGLGDAIEQALKPKLRPLAQGSVARVLREYEPATAREVAAARDTLRRTCSRDVATAHADQVRAALSVLYRDVGRVATDGPHTNDAWIERGHWCLARTASPGEVQARVPSLVHMLARWSDPALRSFVASRNAQYRRSTAPLNAAVASTTLVTIRLRGRYERYERNPILYINGHSAGNPRRHWQPNIGAHFVHVRYRQGNRWNVSALRMFDPRREARTLEFDLSLSAALRVGDARGREAMRLHYANGRLRNEQHADHAARLAVELGASEAIVWWLHDERVVYLSRVDKRGRIIGSVQGAIDRLDSLTARLTRGGRAPGWDQSRFLRPAPGHVPVELASEKGRQRITLLRSSLWPTPVASPLCETPCTLFLPPGRVWIRTAGDGVSSGTTRFVVAPNGNNTVLRTKSQTGYTAGRTLMGLGLGTMLGVAIAGGISESLAGGLRGLLPGDGPPGEADNDYNSPPWMGAVILGGALALAAGSLLAYLYRPGVKANRPRSPAKLQWSGGVSNGGLFGGMRLRW